MRERGRVYEQGMILVSIRKQCGVNGVTSNLLGKAA